MRILIAAGGTGGHLYPGIALAREFKRQAKDSEILFVGTSRGLEGRVLEREGFPLRLIRVEGLMGRRVIKILKALLLLPLSLADTSRVLKSFLPDLVIGIGGYASGPVILLAGFFKTKRVVLEPNVMPGWTNRVLTRIGRVDLLILAFEESRVFFSHKPERVLVLGNPVRRDLVLQPTSDAPSGNTLLVLGGSQGAHSINLAMVQALGDFKRLKPDLFIIHQTGERDFDRVRRAYDEKGVKARVEPFLFDMEQVYGQSDLVLCRAGAITLAELTACGKPAILVPYPHATHNHQFKNAMALADAGAAIVVEDRSLIGPVVVEKVLGLMGDRERLGRMAQQSKAKGNPQATEDIVKHCLELIKAG
jgi:UDP-N-acetylglucosamine--N-acetylmuramyl-(pentapeptide) pyrophosphoryl-undecaprenol N-acetylglucosamine transferase